MAEISNYIGRDNYGDVVQAGGDANVTKVSGPTDALEALKAVRRLRAALDGADLTPADKAAAADELAAMEDELKAPQPRRESVATRLGRITEVLTAAGALAAAGTALAPPLAVVAAFLGLKK